MHNEAPRLVHPASSVLLPGGAKCTIDERSAQMRLAVLPGPSLACRARSKTHKEGIHMRSSFRPRLKVSVVLLALILVAAAVSFTLADVRTSVQEQHGGPASDLHIVYDNATATVLSTRSSTTGDGGSEDAQPWNGSVPKAAPR